MSILKLKGNASGTGTVTLEAPNTNTDQTIAIPDGAGSFVTANASGDVAVTGDVTVSGAFTSQGIDDNATSTALTLGSDGKLLVGTTSSSRDGAFVATDSGAEVGFSFRNNATANDTSSAIYLQSWTSDSTQAGVSKISNFKDTSTYGTTLRFYTTTGSAGNTTEAMRIDSGQAVLIGIDSAAGLGTKDGLYIAASGASIYTRSTTSSVNFFEFFNPNGKVGSIVMNSSSTSYNTSSDYRLKENVVDLTGASDRVNQIPVHRFNFISNPDTTVDGFLAHEVQAVVPEAITGEHNEVDEDGNPIYQQIDQAKIVPLLTAALQEALAKIETLETEMTSVKARLDALEAV